MDNEVQVSEYGASEVDVFNQPCGITHLDHVAYSVLVFQKDEYPTEKVPDQALGAKPDGDTNDPSRG